MNTHKLFVTCTNRIPEVDSDLNLASHQESNETNENESSLITSDDSSVKNNMNTHKLFVTCTNRIPAVDSDLNLASHQEMEEADNKPLDDYLNNSIANNDDARSKTNDGYSTQKAIAQVHPQPEQPEQPESSLVSGFASSLVSGSKYLFY